MKKFFAAGLLVLICGMLCSCGDSGSEPSTATGKQMFFAMYMVGSDLESRGNHGTNDLLDIVKGYRRLSTAERNNLGLLVAFGGSSKETWNGIRYADAACLSRDAADGIFGNDTCYSYVALKDTSSSGNMSDKNTLIHFLNTAKALSVGYETVFIDFWDHGGSYLGFGNDENFSKRCLSTATMAEAFRVTGFRPRIIGFDACLMGSVEVAAKLYPYADYIVTSENSEPPHGWDYNLLIGNYRNAPTARKLAEAVVDGYIDSPAHASSEGKTLSVIETASYASFQDSLDRLSVKLAARVSSDYATMVNIIEKSAITGSYITMDLVEFLAFAKTALPELGGDIDGLVDRLSETMVYFRQDGTRASSHGISIYGMSNSIWTNNEYTEENSASSLWYAFVASYLMHDDLDVTDPVVTPVDPGLCGKESDSGLCYEISDNYAVTRADAVLALEIEASDKYEIIAMKPLVRTSGNYYFRENFEGKVLRVCSGNDFCFTTDTQVTSDMTAFAFTASIQQQMATVTADFSSGTFVGYWVASRYVPGQLLLPKDKGTIDPGDLVVPFQQTLYFNKGRWYFSDDKSVSGIYIFSQAPTFSLIDADPTAQAFIMARDGEGHVALYDTSGAIQTR